jgi:glycerol-3-phosphate dehydrogenase
MIGPTETPYHGAVDDWRLTLRSITDFLEVINRIAQLPEPLTLVDVRYAWGGLRPLTETAGNDTYGASRASETVDHARDGLEGLVTVAGGKYTTSRAFAQHTVDLLGRKLRATLAPSASARTYLDACAIPRLEPHVRAVVAQNPHVDPRTVEFLVRHYGTDAPAVLALADEDPTLAEPLDDDGEILAQVLWAVRHEMAPHLTDVLLRRTGLGTLGRPADDVLAGAARVAAGALGWDGARLDAEVAAVLTGTALPV